MTYKILYPPRIYPFLILMFFAFVAHGQQITRMDFGINTQVTSGNWNNFTVQNVAGTAINLIDVNGAPTGEILTLTDVFDLYERNDAGTRTPTVFPFLDTASRDNFFGESVFFDNRSTNPGSTETTGGFTLSGLEIGKFYSFTIFASRTGVLDNRETLYTIIGNSGPQTATLDPANNTTKVATIINVEPDANGEINIQATTGPNNTNPFGFYYLGAMEVSKTTLPKPVIWNGTNWIGGVPNLQTSARISGDYNTLTDGSFEANSLIVDEGFFLVISNGEYVEVENDMMVHGAINVQTKGNFVQNDNGGSFTVNPDTGKASFNKQTPVKNAWYYYTYWSSPVVGQTIADAFPNTDGDRRFSFNAANYIDANNDFVDDDDNDWEYALGGMTPGVGYAATSGRLGIYPSSDSADFIGPFNTGNVPTGISYNAANSTTTGTWNLIGNPYPSAIDFIAFQAANASVIDGVAYFWSQASPPDSGNPGNEVYNFSQNDYAMFTVGSGGIQGASGVIPNQYIPSGQGFFVIGLDNNTATFTNAMRMADNSSNSQFFKSSNTKNKSNSIDNKFWINLSTDSGVFNQILVAYVDGATNGNDGLSYDAPRIITPDFSAVLYLTIDSSNKKFAIQGKDKNSLSIDETVKLGFDTKIGVPSLYKLSIAQIQGAFLKGNTIYLKDNLLHKLHNLSTGAYTFTSETGEFNDRFEIVFDANALSTDAIISNEKMLHIVELKDNHVQFKVSNNLKISSVGIFDLLGRQLYSFKGQNSTETYKISNLNSTVYIAKVTLSNGAVITKKAIKK